MEIKLPNRIYYISLIVLGDPCLKSTAIVLVLVDGLGLDRFLDCSPSLSRIKVQSIVTYGGSIYPLWLREQNM